LESDEETDNSWEEEECTDGIELRDLFAECEVFGEVYTLDIEEEEQTRNDDCSDRQVDIEA
jgi:hypothetical protein